MLTCVQHNRAHLDLHLTNLFGLALLVRRIIRDLKCLKYLSEEEFKYGALGGTLIVVYN